MFVPDGLLSNGLVGISCSLLLQLYDETTAFLTECS